MASYYLTEDNLEISDPVCLMPGQPGKVRKATTEALQAACAVLGVVIIRPVLAGEWVQVGDSGIISATQWNPAGLDMGTGPLLVARAGRCVRTTLPESTDYTIGLIQDDGTLIIQRDYELSLATHRMINVRDFGATGDGSTDDSPAFEASLAALPPYPYSSTGTIVFIPPGQYRLSRDLEIKREIHLLGGGGAAGNAGVKLIFDPGYGIVVHSHFSTPQPGQFGNGCVIEGLGIFGTPPGALPGGAYTESFPTRWQPNMGYEPGSRVFMFRATPREWQARHRYGVGERIRPPGRFDVVFEAYSTSTGNSGGTPPDWDSRVEIPGVGLVVRDNEILWVEPDGIQEWRPGHEYPVRQKIRPPGRCDVIFQLHPSSDDRRMSGDGPFNWNRREYVNDVGWVIEDNGIRWVLQDDALIDIQGYRDFYWECVRPGVSGPLTPEIAPPGALFTAEKASVIDLSSEWQRGEQYHVGQVIHPPNRFDMILVMNDDSSGDTSGDMEPNWDAGGVVEDSGIRWLKRDPSPYFFSEGPEGPVWRCRVHAGIRMHSTCLIRNCFIQGFLNAGIWIGAGGYFPIGNANGWMVQQTLIAECGTGILVRGTDAHQGTAINVTCAQIGRLSGLMPPEIDWSPTDRGGNGGIAFCDLSYYGNQYISCIAEENSDRGLVMEGTVNQSGTVIRFWDEGNKREAYLSGSTMLVGGLFVSGRGIDPRSVHARVGRSDFRQVEEVNEKAPRQTRAMLHQQDADGVFMWTANRASGPGSEYNNTIGWRYLPSGNPVHWDAPVSHDWPVPHEWKLSYQENNPASYFTVQDGFGPLGISWRDPVGHFRGDDAYYLGFARNSEKDNGVRRGFRQIGDRFEPPIGPYSSRGRFLGRIVDRNGFRGWDSAWTSGVEYFAYWDYTGWAASTIEVTGFVFICTRRGVGGSSAPDFEAAIRARTAPGMPRLSPIFEKGLILSSWLPNTIQQLGMIKRPNRRHTDGRYYLFVCSKVEGYGSTGTREPDWPNAPGVEITEEVWDNGFRKRMISRVTWKCLGPDPDDTCIVDEPTGLQWTCAGPVATFAEYGPVYERGEADTDDSAEIKLDEYPIPPRTCAQFDVVVTCLQRTDRPAQAAAFTLRAACYHNAIQAYTIPPDYDIERRSTREELGARLQIENRPEGSFMCLYVHGAEDLSLRWRSIRRPHIDANW